MRNEASGGGQGFALFLRNEATFDLQLLQGAQSFVKAAFGGDKGTVIESGKTFVDHPDETFGADSNRARLKTRTGANMLDWKER